jgi:fucose 4-O-acetylase-like acetyltransferase
MRPTRRDPWLDNVKMTLVTLVVIGHSWGLLAGTELDVWAYNFLYYWHIPAFVLVTGYLSRTFVWDRPHLWSLLTTIALPYLIFEPVLFYYRDALGQHESGALLLVPHWGMWYLPVIFVWRLATPILKRHWAWLPASVAISLVGGLSTAPYLCLPRILGLLPFFVLGLHLDKAKLDLLRFWWLRPVAILALGWIFWFARGTEDWARTAFLLYDAGYSDLDWAAGDAMRIRLIVMAVGLLGTLSVLVLIPRRGGWYSRMGAATLAVYLFHGFFVRYAEYAGWQDWSGRHPDVSLVVTTASAIGLSLFLASPPLRRALTWAVDPVGSIQRHRRPAAPEPVGIRERVGPRSG